MKKTASCIIVITIFALFSTCTNQQPKTLSEKIDSLKQQVMSDAKTLQEIENKNVAILQKDFVHCDSMLQYLPQEQVEANFEHLNLTKAYLVQFNEVKPVMERKLNYVVQQLDNLKSDVESFYLSDSLASVYFETENRVADTLHAQLKYFQDRFKNCQQSLDKLKKSYPKR